jgi:hypothetical protein
VQAILFGAVALLANAVQAPELDWVEFGQIIQQSRLVSSSCPSPAYTFAFSLWAEFGHIIQQSNRVNFSVLLCSYVFANVVQFHATTSDFVVLTLSAPFWMYNDMTYRNW